MALFSDKRRSSMTYSQNEKVNRNAVAAAHTIGKLFQGPTGSSVNNSQVSISRRNSMRFNKTSRSYNDQLKSMLNESEVVEPDYSGFANFSETTSVSSVPTSTITKHKQKKVSKASSSPSPAPHSVPQRTSSNLSKSSLSSNKPKIIRKVVPTAHGLRTIEVSAAEDAREYQQTISRTSSMTSSIRTPSKNHNLRKHSSFTSASPSPKFKGYSNYQHHDFKSFDDLVLEEDSNSSTLKPPSALSNRSTSQISTPQKNRHKRVSFNESSSSPGINSIINNSIIEEDDDASAMNTELTPLKNNYNHSSPLKFKNNNNSSSSLKLKRNTISGPISSSTSSKPVNSKHYQRGQTKSIVHREDSSPEIIKPSVKVSKPYIPALITPDQAETPVAKLVKKEEKASEPIISEDKQVEPIPVSVSETDDQMIQLSSQPLEPPSEVQDEIERSKEEAIVVAEFADSIKEVSAVPNPTASSLTTGELPDSIPSPIASTVTTKKLDDSNPTTSTLTTSKLADAPKIDVSSKPTRVFKSNSMSRKPSQRLPEAKQAASKGSLPYSIKTGKPNSNNSAKLSKRHSMIEKGNAQQNHLPLGAAAASVSIKKAYATKTGNNGSSNNKIRPVSMSSAPPSSFTTPKKESIQQIKPKPLFNGTGIQRSASTARSFRNNMGNLESPAPLHTKSSFEKLRGPNASNGNTANSAFKRHSMRDFSGGMNTNAATATATTSVNGSGYTSPISIMKSRFADSDSEDEGFGSSIPGKVGGFNRLSLREPSKSVTVNGPEPISTQSVTNHSMFGFGKIHQNNQNHVGSISEEPEALKTPSTINSDKLFEKHLSESKKGFFKSQLDNSYSNYHKQKKEAKLQKSMAHGIDSMLLGDNNEEIVEKIPKKGRFSKFKKIFGKK